jgi:hypothetical protein
MPRPVANDRSGIARGGYRRAASFRGCAGTGDHRAIRIDRKVMKKLGDASLSDIVHAIAVDTRD